MKRTIRHGADDLPGSKRDDREDRRTQENRMVAREDVDARPLVSDPIA